MSEAILRLSSAGGEALQRVLGQVQSTYRTVANTVNAEARRAARERTQMEREETQGARRELAARYAARSRAAADAARAERERTRAALREGAERTRAEQRAQREMQRALQQATRATEAESAKKVRIVERELAQVARLATAMVISRERAERQATAAADRESTRRVRIADREAASARQRVIAGLGRGAIAVGRAGLQYASAMHGEIQDARGRRASSEHTINSALYQVGARGAEAAELREQVYAFTRGRGRGLDSGAVGAAIARTQTETNSLAGATPAERRQHLSTMLDNAELARNTYQDPGEVMRIGGVLANRHMAAGDIRSTLLALTGAAQSGSIELGAVSSQALAPIMQNIAMATERQRRENPHASAAERSGLVGETVRRSLAVAEVAGASGLSARDSSNAYVKLQRAFSNDNTQTNLYNRLRSRQGGAAVVNEMFETATDDRGRQVHRLREHDSLKVASRLLQAYGGNSAAMLNAMAGGGHGAPQILDSQTRRFVGGLASQTENGETISARVARMQASSATEADVAAGRALVDAEQNTQIVGAREDHDSTLTDNTSAIVGMSNAIENWKIANPWLAGAGGTASGLVTGAGGAAVGAGTTAGGLATLRSGAGSIARGAGGALRTAGSGIARLASGAAGFLSELLRPGNEHLTGGADAFDDAAALRAHRSGAGVEAASRAGSTGQRTGAFAASHTGSGATIELGPQTMAALPGVMARAQITVSPVDAAHAATVARTGADAPPPGSGARGGR